MATTGKHRGDLPEDRCLAEVAVALEEAGHFAEIVDADWRSVYSTAALRAAAGFLVDAETDTASSGAFAFGREQLDLFASTPIGSIALDYARARLEQVGEWVVHDLAGGRDRLRALIDPRLDDVVDRITETGRSSAITYSYDGYGPAGSRPRMVVTASRIRRPDGELAGTVFVQKPALSMMTLATLGAMGDPGHLDRQQEVAAAGRRPGAIMFADLEGSTPLAKQLSTSSYFALARRMTRMADQSIVEAGGITGRHSGDGVVAFFLADHLGSESAAARSCVHRALRNRWTHPGVQGSRRTPHRPRLGCHRPRPRPDLLHPTRRAPGSDGEDPARCPSLAVCEL
jgi:hypothetical protein